MISGMMNPDSTIAEIAKLLKAFDAHADGRIRPLILTEVIDRTLAIWDLFSNSVDRPSWACLVSTCPLSIAWERAQNITCGGKE